MGDSDLAADIAARTDSYFNRTRKIVARFGDKRVTYAVFMRRPVISAPRLMTEWLEAVAASRNTRFDIELMYAEGALGRRRRAAGLYQRQPGASVRSRDDPAAEDRPGLGSGAQCVSDVPVLAGCGVPGDGGAPLRRRRDAGHDGVRGLGRQQCGKAGRGEGLRRQRQRRHRALVRLRRAASARCRTR